MAESYIHEGSVEIVQDYGPPAAVEAVASSSHPATVLKAKFSARARRLRIQVMYRKPPQ